MVIGIVLLVTVSALLLRGLVRAIRRPTDAFVDEWARAHALVVTPDNRSCVVRYLHRGRQLRCLGAVAGLVLPYPVAAAAGFDIHRFGASDWLFVYAGYLVGALCAELALGRPLPSSTERTAALIPRRLADYLPARLRVAQRALGLMAAGLGTLALVVELRPAGNPPISPGAAFGAGIAGLAVAIAIEAVERYVVRRPQPVVHPDLLAADDAIRASSLHSIAGSGIAIVLLLVAAIAATLAAAEADGLQRTMGWLGFAAGLASFVAWLYYGNRAWRVQRVLPRSTAVPAPQ